MIMEIDALKPFQRIASASSIKKPVRTGSKFSVSDTTEAKEVQSTERAAASNSLSNIMSLSLISTEEQKQKDLYNHGEDIISVLKGLRVSLIYMDQDEMVRVLKMLQGISSKMQDKTTNAELNSIVSEIKLRAEVEIAKYKRSMPGKY